MEKRNSNQKLLRVLFLLVVLAVGFTSHAQPNKEASGKFNTIPFEGGDFWINGFNVAWNHFGGDFGNHVWWGASYDSAWFENLFTQCEEYGANVVRLWIHCDGRANPEFDAEGNCIGFDTDFFMDLDDCFRRAKHHGIYIMPCVWSFDMCKDFREGAGPFAGAHYDLLIDEDKMNTYLDNAFTPLVKRYADQCNLFAWEVCNEPEWALDRSRFADTNWTYRTDSIVPIESMQLLTARMAAIVHENSDKMVTTGSAAIRWNSNVSPAVQNLWSDESLQKVYPDPKAHLDFYQIHFYDYMNPLLSDPYDTLYPTTHWEFDKPVIIGETPASPEKSILYTNDEMMERAMKNGYAGIMFWSFNGHDGYGGWKDFKDPIKRNADKYPDLVKPIECPCLALDASTLNLKTTAAGSKLKVSFSPVDALTFRSLEFQLSVDGETWKKGTKVTTKGWEVTNYQAKVKVKDAKYYRLVHTDVYGYSQTSDMHPLGK